MDVAETEPGLALPLGVRLLLAEWDTSDQYAYHDLYDDQQPASSPMPHASIPKRGGREQAQTTQLQRPLAVVTTAPPVIVRSRVIPISSSQPESRHLAVDSLDTTANPHSEPRTPLLASTQIEPGPFGGRPLTGRKKAVPTEQVCGYPLALAPLGGDINGVPGRGHIFFFGICIYIVQDVNALDCFSETI
jgi:hypothetical protein